MYGSPIQRCPEQFNIETLVNAPIDRIMYPSEFLEKGFAFVYDFKRKEPYEEQDWNGLVTEWKTRRERAEIEGVQNKSTIDRLIFYYVDGGTFLKVYDKRDIQNIRIFVLNESERAVFLACTDVISLPQLQEHVPWIPEFELVAILQSLEQNGLVIEDGKQYLSLPLVYRERTSSKQTKEYSADMIVRPMCSCRSM